MTPRYVNLPKELGKDSLTFFLKKYNKLYNYREKYSIILTELVQAVVYMSMDGGKMVWLWEILIYEFYQEKRLYK